MPNSIKTKPLQSPENSIRRRAKAFQRIERNGRVGWLYEWNTGAIDVIFAPDDFAFDRSRARHLQVQSTISD